MLDLRIVALKSLRSGGSGSRTEQIRNMERELSFDETPTFNFKMSRPASLRFFLPKIIPCLISTTPSVDDLDNDNDNDREDWVFFEGERECECDHSEEEEEEGIDSKAEEFITKFYEQMKLQRQVSLIEY